MPSLNTFIAACDSGCKTHLITRGCDGARAGLERADPPPKSTLLVLTFWRNAFWNPPTGESEHEPIWCDFLMSYDEFRTCFQEELLSAYSRDFTTSRTPLFWKVCKTCKLTSHGWARKAIVSIKFHIIPHTSRTYNPQLYFYSSTTFSG